MLNLPTPPLCKNKLVISSLSFKLKAPILKSKCNAWASKLAYLLALIMVCFVNSVWAELDVGEKYMQNKQTGKLIDVKGGSTTAGTQIWQYTINYTKSQAFNTYRSVESETYLIQSGLHGSKGLYLSLKLKQLKLIVADTGVPSASPATEALASSVSEASANPAAAHSESSNYIVTQEEKYAAGQVYSATYNQPHQQLWKFVPVANEQNTYTIQSMTFSTNFVLQPTSMQSKGSLAIAPYTGAEIQKWIVLPTVPAEPTNLKLEKFNWKPYQITGNFLWKDNANGEDGYKVWVARKESNGTLTAFKEINDEPANSTSSVIKVDSVQGKGKEHCLRLEAFNRWGSAQETVCATPSSESPPPPPPPVGYSSISITNCDDDQPPRSLRIWTLDITQANASWVNQGDLSTGWAGQNCNPASPKKTLSITGGHLKDGHRYQVVAVGCGGEAPNISNSSCHKLTSPPIPVKSGKGPYPIGIN